MKSIGRGAIMDDCCGANRNNFLRRITRHVLVGLLSVLVFPVFAGNSRTDKAHFDIPAGKLDETILHFAEQAHLSVSHGNDTFDGIRTHAVLGEFEIGSALSLLLKGTEVVAEWGEE
jgi:hypothetical protein